MGRLSTTECIYLPTYPYSTEEPCDYDEVCRQEFFWPPYYLAGPRKEFEAVNAFQHQGEYGVKPPYRFGTHEEDTLAELYSKLHPNVLILRPNSVSKHKMFNAQHEQLISTTRTCIVNLRNTIDMDGWRKTACLSIELMQTAPGTSFDENRNPGNAPGYQWCS